MLLQKISFCSFLVLCLHTLLYAQKTPQVFPSDSIATSTDGVGLSITPYYKGKPHGWSYDFTLSYHGAATIYELEYKSFYYEGNVCELHIYNKGILAYKVIKITYFSTQTYIENKVWLPCYSCKYEKGYMVKYRKNGKKHSEGYILFVDSPEYGEYLKLDKWIYYDTNGKIMKVLHFKKPAPLEDIDRQN